MIKDPNCKKCSFNRKNEIGLIWDEEKQDYREYPCNKYIKCQLELGK